MGRLFGMQEINAEKMTEKVEQMLPIIKKVNAQFRDKVSSVIMYIAHGICFGMCLNLSNCDVICSPRSHYVIEFTVMVLLHVKLRPKIGSICTLHIKESLV